MGLVLLATDRPANIRSSCTLRRVFDPHCERSLLDQGQSALRRVVLASLNFVYERVVCQSAFTYLCVFGNPVCRFIAKSRAVDYQCFLQQILWVWLHLRFLGRLVARAHRAAGVVEAIDAGAEAARNVDHAARVAEARPARSQARRGEGAAVVVDLRRLPDGLATMTSARWPPTSMAPRSCVGLALTTSLRSCAAMATSRLASAVPTRTGVAPLALPVLRAVSCTTMRMPRAALKTMR
ncbi:hypothetical protein APY03_3646 [Variovorax sp. WDL1]|nr:hypothetical protein APY03_3646 [Variovorax sp. WDL1]